MIVDFITIKTGIELKSLKYVKKCHFGAKYTHASICELMSENVTFIFNGRDISPITNLKRRN